MTFLRLFYNLCFPVVLVMMLPSILLRMVRRGNYRHKFGQRFGMYSRRVLDKLSGHRWTWVHAVSVGEVMIALKLIEAVRERQPDLRVVLSTTTSTGYRLAHRRKSPFLEPIYTPLDIPGVVARALNAAQPDRLILVEAEVWPNMMAAAKKRGLPVILINARLSPRSERRYRIIRPWAAALFNQLDALCAQEPADARRWERLGVRKEKIRMTGSVKFDPAREGLGPPPRDLRPILENLGVSVSAPVLLGGSTFEGEEVILAECLRDLRARIPGLFLILVPRHAERAASLHARLSDMGFQVALRQGGEPVNAPEILLVNTTGELKDWYAQATVVFMGKSLTARGGQNPAEAIAAGRPVLFGPNMRNFASLARQMTESGGAIVVPDAQALRSAVEELLDDPVRRETMAAAAATCLNVHRGATARTIAVLEEFP